MRIARLGTASVLGFLLIATLAGPPAAAGCSSLVAQTTRCVTAIYDSAKGNAGTLATQKAAALSAWSGAGPQALLLCSPQAFEVPGTEYNPQPAIDGNLQYLEEQQGAAGTYANEVRGNPFAATGAFGAAAWLNTQNVFARWNERLFDPVLGEVGAWVSDPGVPDPSEVDPGQAPAAAQASASCAQAAPMPAL